MTAVATIPNTDITGLGTMAVQNANAVAITGGSMTLTGAVTTLAPPTTSAELRLEGVYSGAQNFVVKQGINGVSNGGFSIRNNTTGRNSLVVFSDDTVGAGSTAGGPPDMSVNVAGSSTARWTLATPKLKSIVQGVLVDNGASAPYYVVTGGTDGSPSITTQYQYFNNHIWGNGGGSQAMSLDASGNLTTNGAVNVPNSNVAVGGLNADPFGRGYNRVLGISSAGSAAIEINAVSGSAAFLDLGAGGVRIAQFATDATGTSLGPLTNIPITFLTNSTNRWQIQAAGDLQGIAPAGGAQANVRKIKFPNDYSNGVIASNCKLMLYDDGGANRFGFTVGGNADVQYHSGNNSTNGRHDFYTDNVLRLSIGSSAFSTMLNMTCTGNNIQVKQPGLGGIGLNQSGNAANTGYMEFYKGDGTRVGYIGFQDTASGTGGSIRYNNEIGGNHFFTGYVGMGVNPPVRRLHLMEAGPCEFVLEDSTAAANIKRFRLVSVGGQFLCGSLNDAASAGQETWRINTGNQFLVGTPSAFDGVSVCRMQVQDGIAINTQNTGPQTAMSFFNNQGSSVRVGWIGTSGSATSFNTSSDARLKENVAPAEPSGSIIDAIQVRQFDWILDGKHVRYGSIAQELVQVYPEAVALPPEGVADAMLGVDYSTIVPLLIKEIQDLRARVAFLEGYGNRTT